MRHSRRHNSRASESNVLSAAMSSSMNDDDAAAADAISISSDGSRARADHHHHHRKHDSHSIAPLPTMRTSSTINIAALRLHHDEHPLRNVNQVDRTGDHDHDYHYHGDYHNYDTLGDSNPRVPCDASIRESLLLRNALTSSSESGDSVTIANERPRTLDSNQDRIGSVRARDTTSRVLEEPEDELEISADLCSSSDRIESTRTIQLLRAIRQELSSTPQPHSLVDSVLISKVRFNSMATLAPSASTATSRGTIGESNDSSFSKASSLSATATTTSSLSAVYDGDIDDDLEATQSHFILGTKHLATAQPSSATTLSSAPSSCHSPLGSPRYAHDRMSPNQPTSPRLQSVSPRLHSISPRQPVAEPPPFNGSTTTSRATITNACKSVVTASPTEAIGCPIVHQMHQGYD